MKLFLFRYNEISGKVKTEIVEVIETTKVYILKKNNIFAKNKLLKINENKLIYNKNYFEYFTKNETDFSDIRVKIINYYSNEIYKTKKTYKHNLKTLDKKLNKLLKNGGNNG